MAEYASRYARALVDIVTSSDSGLDAGAMDRELGDFLAVWDESRELREAFLDPSVSALNKVAVLDKLSPRLGLSKTVRNFLAVLSNHGRMDGVREVIAAYRATMRVQLGVEEVEFTTARALGEAERRAVLERIGSLGGKRVEAIFTEDPALVGGARLRIGSMIYDGSVRGRLDELKERLAAL